MKRPLDGFLALLRWLITGSSALVICACYGVAGRVSPDPKQKSIRTLDEAGAPIQNLRVDLLDDGNILAWFYTDSQGSGTMFQPNGNLSFELRVRDVDGPDHGGDFQDQTVPFTFDDKPVHLVMKPKPALSAVPAAGEAPGLPVPQPPPADAPAPH